MFHRRRAESTSPTETSADWQSYDTGAEAYERVTAPRYALPARDLVTVAGIGPGHRVLDVGTGTGVAALAAVEAVGSDGLVVGVDPATAMLGIAAAKGSAARFVGGEALDLPFRDGAFNAVVANFVLSHFTKYETALFDMVRVLRPGGRLALSTWSAGEDEFSRTWREAAEVLVGKDLYRDAVRRGLPWQDRFSDPEPVREALNRAGLRPVDVEQRTYRFEMTIEDYLEGQELRMVARSLRHIMGQSIWERFRDQVREEFRSRFRDPIGDTRDVWFGSGTKS